jgi:iron(III) transport system substrate-binding protein
MKKVMVMLLVAALLIGVFRFTPVRAAQNVVIQMTIGSTKAYINSKETSLDQPPIIENGRTLVPFRFIGEALGAEIGWDPVKKAVSYDVLGVGGKSIILIIGSTTAFVDNIATKLDVAPKILSGRTMVPVRFVSETIGAKVDWNSSTKMVTVTGTKPGGGKLVVYSAENDVMIKKILYYFGQKYNIDISLQSMGTGVALAKMRSEKSNPQADVLFGGLYYGEWHDNQDLFQEYVAKGNSKLPKDVQNPNGFITRYDLIASSPLIINTDLEKSLGISIKSYADLLNPVLKGKVVSADPAASASAYAQLCNILLDEGGYETPDCYTSPSAWGFVKKLMGQIVLSAGSSAVIKGVLQGEYVVGLTWEGGAFQMLEEGAKNIRVIYPSEGTVFLPNAAGIVAGAKNLDNAKLFMDFLISDEAQTIMSATTNRPINPNIKITNPYMIPISSIKRVYEDMEYTGLHRQQILAKWAELWAEVKH